MKIVPKLTENDIRKYRQEIDKVDLNEKIDILHRSEIKLNNMLNHPDVDNFQFVLVQEINILHIMLKTNPNLEKSIQQKIIFALKYFLLGEDDIPDNIPGMGFIDDLAVVDWVIKDIKDQYSHYFQA